MAKYDNFSKEELIELLKKQDKELARKKYGLVWDSEKEPERVVLDCAKNLPVLKSVNEKDIKTNDDDYNVMIEGDNYHALQVLNYTHKGKIDVIYIDPPYNTGKDKEWKYNDKYIDKNDGYRHSKWLNFMEKRLDLAKELLNDKGVIFISIDDKEQANLRLLCDHIFGEANFLGMIHWQTTTDNNPRQISTEHEYIISFAKNIELQKKWIIQSEKILLIQKKYNELKLLYGNDTSDIQKELRKWIKLNKNDLKGVTHYDNVDEKGVFHDGDIANTKFGGYKYNVIHPVTGKPCKIPEKGFRYPQETMEEMIAENNILFGEDENTLIKPKFRIDTAKELLKSYYYEDNRAATKLLESMFNKKDIFKNPKSLNLIERLIHFSSNKDALILDFFAGSGTTGHAVLELNKQDAGTRKFILCTNNEGNIAEEVCYPRISKVIHGYNKNGNGEFVDGLGGNLKYFKTDFVVNSKNRTQTKINIAKQCSEMLCLKTGIYNLITEQSNSFKIFDNNKHNQFLCVYFDFFDDEMSLFIEKLKKLDGNKFIFVFVLDDNLDTDIISALEDAKIEPIPQKILDVYRKIAKEHIKGEIND